MSNKFRDKIIRKVAELVDSSSVKFCNGSQIKRVSFGDWDMNPFQINKRKYKFGIVISEKCNNQTNFIPTGNEFQLIDYKAGMVYSKIEDISKFLSLTIEETQQLLLPMVEKSRFTEDEIHNSIEEYREWVVSFRKDFLGIEDNEQVKNYIKNTDIKNII